MFLQNFLKKPNQPVDIIIVGLGNPGKQYKNTPHNAGFDVVDSLVRLLQEREKDIQEQHTKQYALYQVSVKSKNILLIKPLLFMNRSGIVVKQILEQYTLPNLKNLWIVHDEIDLPFATLRISFDSQSAGNKGVQDIIDNIDSQQFYRFRVGVRPDKAFNTEQYVTQKLEKQDIDRLNHCVKQCIVALIQSIQTSPEQTKNYTLESK